MITPLSAHRHLGSFIGCSSQVYEGLKYKLSLEFPSNYPYTAPIIKFITNCFHPNVDKFGNICLDILKEKWSSALDVKAVLMSIQSLLGGRYIAMVTVNREYPMI